MSDPNFKIVITGDAAGAVQAADQASAGIKKLVVSTEGLNAETQKQLGLNKDLSQEMGVVRVSQDEVNKILGKGAETTDMSHLAMRRLAHAMGSEVPGGAALMESGFTAATEPMMGATFLLIGGIEMLRNAITKINEERKESQKIADDLAEVDKVQIGTIDAQREALEKAEVAEAEFHHNFVRNAENAIDSATALAQAILKSTTSSASTRHNIADKELDDMEQRGVISHAAALKAKEQLDIEYEQQKLAREKAMDVLERGILQAQLDSKKINADNLARQEQSAEAAYKTAATAKAANDEKIKQAQEKITGAEGVKKSLEATGVTEENVQMLRESFEKVSGQNAAATPLSEQFHYLATHLGGMYVRGAFGTEGDKNLATYEGANLDIEGAKKDIARARGRQTDLDINAGNAESDLQSTRQEMQKNKDQVRELEDKITVQTATSKLKEAGAQQDLGLQKANSELVSDRDIAGRVAAGGQVSGDEQQQIMADAAKIAGHNVNLQTAAQIIQNGAENMGIFMNQLGILARSFAQFGPGQMAQFQAQLDEIRAQMGEIARTGSH